MTLIFFSILFLLFSLGEMAWALFRRRPIRPTFFYWSMMASSILQIIVGTSIGCQIPTLLAAFALVISLRGLVWKASHDHG